jgi:hypothetical protein
MLAGALLSLLTQVPSPPRALDWDDFPVFVWRETHKGKPLPTELADPFGGVILMRGEEPLWARELGLTTLVWNAAGRDQLHLDADEAWRARVEGWIETKDEALLVRSPCLRAQETRAELYWTLTDTLERHGTDSRLTYVLGDEVGTTPNGDPFDLCRCELCESAWKEHAARSGLPERAPLTDEVLDTLRAGDTRGLGAWLARRRFERQTMLDLLLALRARMLGHPPYEPGIAHARREQSPLPGLLGTKGLTAFGGLDLASMGGLFEIVEPYPVNEAREALSSSGHIRNHASPIGRTGSSDAPMASLVTIFLGEETPDGAAWRLWEHWLRGGNGAVLWSDSVLERSPAHRVRLAEAVRDIRKLSELYCPRQHRDGALVYDADSISASFLRDALEDGDTWPRRTAGYQAQHGTRDRMVQSWLRLIEDCGVLPAALPLVAVRGDCAREFSFLVLPEILVLSESDLAHLEEFVAAGGKLILDGGFGWVDRSGTPWKADLTERLERSAQGRVLRAPDSLEDYLEQRFEPERAAAARSFLAPILAPFLSPPRHELKAAAVLPALDATLPWLVNRDITLPSSGLPHPVAAFLPNLTTPAERARLRALELPKADTLGGKWLHPSEGTTLRPGDAAVFHAGHFIFSVKDEALNPDPTTPPTAPR